MKKHWRTRLKKTSISRPRLSLPADRESQTVDRYIVVMSWSFMYHTYHMRTYNLSTRILMISFCLISDEEKRGVPTASTTQDCRWNNTTIQLIFSVLSLWYSFSLTLCNTTLNCHDVSAGEDPLLRPTVPVLLRGRQEGGWRWKRRPRGRWRETRPCWGKSLGGEEGQERGGGRGTTWNSLYTNSKLMQFASHATLPRRGGWGEETQEKRGGGGQERFQLLLQLLRRSFLPIRVRLDLKVENKLKLLSFCSCIQFLFIHPIDSNFFRHWWKWKWLFSNRGSNIRWPPLSSCKKCMS